MNTDDLPAELVDHAARAIRDFDPPGTRMSIARSILLAREALAAVLWRVELRSGVGTHVCTIHGRDSDS